MKPEDQLIDALLKEQARQRDADEQLLASIEEAIEAGGARKARPTSPWRRALPLSLAAGLALGGAVIYQRFHDDSPKEALGMGPMPAEPTTTGVPAVTGRAETGAAPAEAAGQEVEPREMALVAPEKPAAAPAFAAEAPQMTAPAPTIVPKVESPTDRGANAAPMTDERKAAIRELELPKSMQSDSSIRVNGSVATSREESDPGVPAPAAGGDGGGGADSLAALRQKLDEPSMSDANRDAIHRKLRERSSELHGPRPRVTKPVAPGEPDPARAPRPAEMLVDRDLSRDHYGQLIDQPWKSPWQEPLSTFSIDVDNASYTNVRRMILEGRPVQPDAVRIEELINYFDYAYPQPEGDAPFAVTSRLATCPWQKDHLLARVAVKGREIDQNARPASNLVFLIDVSGSMQSPDKLPMLKRAMTTLVDSLDERDRVGIVVYAGTEGVALDPTELNDEGKSAALRAIGKLESGGSTNGGAGIARAYRMALGGMIDGGVNRVILATDGDFNVGTTGQGQLVDLVKDNAARGVSLSVLGFGTGNLNDSMLEAVTNDGNGNYFYIDNDREAGRIFQQKLTGTLVTIAKDVKIQVEFNPGKVKAFRLIGYANRILRHQDFNNDKIDAGDIGAGHTVTAFYEIVPAGVDSPFVGEIDELKYQRPADGREVVESDDWFTLKLRHKHPEGVKSRLITTPVTGEPVSWEQAGGDFRMAAAVALFGMKLRGMEEVADIGWDRVREIAEPALADDREEHRAEFLELLKRLD